MAIPVGDVVYSCASGHDQAEPIYMDPAVLCSVDIILSHVSADADMPDFVQLLSSVGVRCPCGEETTLTPSRLEGIGKEKVEKLAASGILTVEALASLDVDHNKSESIDRAIQITGNRRRDGAIRTLAGWKAKAVQYLNRREAAKR